MNEFRVAIIEVGNTIAAGHSLYFQIYFLHLQIYLIFKVIFCVHAYAKDWNVKDWLTYQLRISLTILYMACWKLLFIGISEDTTKFEEGSFT